MHVLFIHRAFPGQFRYIAPRLARDFGWQCTFLSPDQRIPAPAGVTKVPYDVAEPITSEASRRGSGGNGINS